MDDLDRLQKLADSQRREKAKIEGKIESLMEELNDLGYESVAEAEKDTKVMKTKMNKMRSTFETKLNKFRKDYKKEFDKI